MNTAFQMFQAAARLLSDANAGMRGGVGVPPVAFPVPSRFKIAGGTPAPQIALTFY
jgi:hypothetical protein